MSKKSVQGQNAVGRPRGFDRDVALDAAMHVFWAHGYEGASLMELTAAMGINKPSLYAAFGDKRALFAEAVDRYAIRVTDFFFPALEQPTARAVVRALLEGAVRVATHPDGPGGCLFTHGALASSSSATEVREYMGKRRLRAESRLGVRLQRAQEEGDLPQTIDHKALAKYVLSLAQGFAVQGAAGVSHEEMLAAVEVAMAQWPTRD